MNVFKCQGHLRAVIQQPEREHFQNYGRQISHNFRYHGCLIEWGQRIKGVGSSPEMSKQA